MATRPGNPYSGPGSLAQRFLFAAELSLKHRDFDGCRENAIRAQALDPFHPGPTQLLTILSAISASTTATYRRRPDYYAILGVPRFIGNLDLIKHRFQKLSALLNPSGNPYSLSEQAYLLVNEAWFVLSVPANRALFDEELKMEHNFGFGSEILSFWTMCPYCYCVYEYPNLYKECCLRCQNEKCRRAFHAVAIPPPPPSVVEIGKFYCPGFMPIRVEGGGGNGIDSWTPFSPVGSAEIRAKSDIRNGLTGNGKQGDNGRFSNQAFGAMETENYINRAAKAYNVEINGDGRDQKMETNDASVVKMKRKAVATCRNKLMGKGVRIEVIDVDDDDDDTVPLEDTAAGGKSKTEENEGDDRNGEESDLLNGKLEFYKEDDDIFVHLQPGWCD